MYKLFNICYCNVALTYDGTSPEMATLNNSNIMELVRKESNDLSDLLLPANEVKFIEIIGEGIPLMFFYWYMYVIIWTYTVLTIA